MLDEMDPSSSRHHLHYVKGGGVGDDGGIYGDYGSPMNGDGMPSDEDFADQFCTSFLNKML
jgi:hypothetical protein